MKTTEQKAKAYDKALKKAAEIHRSSSYPQEVLHIMEIFPELAESDDEKIRKVLIGWINLEPPTSFNDTFDGFSKEQILAWLEKQGEQKNLEPLDESVIDTEDKRMWTTISQGLSDVKEDAGWSDFGGVPVEEIQEWLKKQGEQKHVEWSEEDKHILCEIIDKLRRFQMTVVGSEFERCNVIIDWLKSLRAQKQWKPSEEQMYWLKKVTPHTDTEKSNEAEAVLTELYEQLKAL